MTKKDLPAGRRVLAAVAAVPLVVAAALGVALALRAGSPPAAVNQVAAGDHQGHPDPGHPPPSRDVTAADEPSPADALVAATAAHIGRWADPRVAEQDGYRSIGDGATGYEHFVHWEWAEDDTVLDPARPESLVYDVGADGTRTLVSAMYILPPGATMDDVPDLGDERAQWHEHDNLCWGTDRRLAGILLRGECVPGGEHVPSPPMIHVWIVDHPCGPFAGLAGHGDGCAHRH